MPITHTFVSGKSDGGDATLVRPSNWNATHTVGGYDIERYTTGDIALTSTSMVAVSGPGDLVVAAATGDLLLIWLSCRATAVDADSIGLDMATMVSGSPVTFLSSLNGTALTTGVTGWYITGDAAAAPHGGGPHFYVVQSGDLSGGNVTLRLYARVSGNRTLGGSSTIPLEFGVKNLS
jgi:hypothetical protein